MYLLNVWGHYDASSAVLVQNCVEDWLWNSCAIGGGRSALATYHDWFVKRRWRPPLLHNFLGQCAPLPLCSQLSEPIRTIGSRKELVRRKEHHYWYYWRITPVTCLPKGANKSCNNARLSELLVALSTAHWRSAYVAYHFLLPTCGFGSNPWMLSLGASLIHRTLKP
jgi:hypothetical protein